MFSTAKTNTNPHHPQGYFYGLYLKKEWSIGKMAKDDRKPFLELKRRALKDVPEYILKKEDAETHMAAANKFMGHEMFQINECCPL
jgi:hypothetical protein